MTESELLGVLVEFSIGLGGFSAIAAAFIHQKQSMSPEDIYRVLNMLLMALGPAFIALFALGILSISVPLQFANGLLLIFILCGVAQAELGMRRLTEEQRKVLIRPIIVTMQIVFILNGLMQIAVVSGLLEGAFIVLYGGLVLVLAQAVVQFVRLIVARPST
jgi:hypothetical protein